MRPKVSIIVIAYNIEQYIDRCLDSIINQTFKDIEIIVVNDGSTDRTLNKILDKSYKDDRIKIIDKKNEGSIEARKSGYEVATGDYILFVDGDDWIKDSSIEILYSTAIKGNYDVVCFKFLWAHSNGNIDKSNQKDINDIENDEFIKLTLIGEIIPSVWSKLIKKKFLDDNNIEFPSNISFAEDLAFSCSIGMYNPKACIINEYLYYYYQRGNSITKKHTSKILDISKATEFIKSKLIEHNKYNKYKMEFEYLAFYHNYFLRIDDIYKISSKYNKILYDIWKKMNINIYNNQYYKIIIKNYSIKSRIIFMLCERSYCFGKYYHKHRKN